MAKKVAKRGKKVAAKKAGGFSLFGKQQPEPEKKGLGNSIRFIGNFAGDAVKGYGGGNGEALFSFPVVAGVTVWILILLRFVLFYGAFGDN